MKNCFQQVADDPKARAVVLSGAGKHFTSGRHNTPRLLNYSSSI